jgi:hypothetical protein
VWPSGSLRATKSPAMAPSAPGPVLHQHRLAQAGLQRLRQDACHRVGGAPGRELQHDLDGLAGPGLGPGRQGGGGCQQQAQGGQEALHRGGLVGRRDGQPHSVQRPMPPAVAQVTATRPRARTPAARTSAAAPWPGHQHPHRQGGSSAAARALRRPALHVGKAALGAVIPRQPAGRPAVCSRQGTGGNARPHRTVEPSRLPSRAMQPPHAAMKTAVCQLSPAHGLSVHCAPGRTRCGGALRVSAPCQPSRRSAGSHRRWSRPWASRWPAWPTARPCRSGTSSGLPSC